MRPAARLIALSLLTLFVPSMAASSIARAECTGPTTPNVTVRIDIPPVSEDRLFGLNELSAMPSASKRDGMEDYTHTLGMMHAQVSEPDIQIDYLTTDDGHGNYCTTAKSATVTLEWKMSVHIAAEIKPGSCLDRTTDEHEQGHVNIDKALIPINQRTIELAVTSVVRNGFPGSSAAATQRALSDQAKVAVDQADEIFTVIRRRQQLAHDSKEEYDRMSDACGLMEYLRLLRDSLKKP